jgi:CubicO group peptidase (beta-lactamase class C family)
MLIEQLTGMSAPDAFQQRIFSPLGLHNYSLPAAEDSSIPDPHPQGYSFGSNTSTIDTYAFRWAWTNRRQPRHAAIPCPRCRSGGGVGMRQPGGAGIRPRPFGYDEADSQEQHAIISEQLAGWVKKYPDVPVRQEVFRGPAEDCLVGYAGRALPVQQPQLIVVGSAVGAP